MKKVIEFDMPAGAAFGKFRHLGGGRFQYNPDAFPLQPLGSEFPALFDGSVAASDPGDFTHFKAEVVDAPEGDMRRVVHFAHFYVGSENVDGGPVSERAIQALADLSGIQEGAAPEWRSADEEPGAMGWYEVDRSWAKYPGVPAHDFWNGTSWLMAAKRGTSARWRHLDANRVWVRLVESSDRPRAEVAP